jgi:Ca2+-binding RTX toxin-like protein
LGITQWVKALSDYLATTTATQSLPIIGQLSTLVTDEQGELTTFGKMLSDTITDSIVTLQSPTPSQVQDLLNTAFQHAKIPITVALSSSDGILRLSAVGHLDGTLDQPLPTDLGLGNLITLSTPATLHGSAGMSVTLNCGVDGNGFFVDTNEGQTAVNLMTDDSLSATTLQAKLGFLSASVTPRKATLHADLLIGLGSTPESINRGGLVHANAFSDLRLTPELSGDLNLDLGVATHLNLSQGQGKTSANLLGINTDLGVKWDLGNQLSPDISLTNTKVPLGPLFEKGGLIDTALSSVKTLAQQINPVVEALTTPVPNFKNSSLVDMVISQASIPESQKKGIKNFISSFQAVSKLAANLPYGDGALILPDYSISGIAVPARAGSSSPSTLPPGGPSQSVPSGSGATTGVTLRQEITPGLGHVNRVVSDFLKTINGGSFGSLSLPLLTNPDNLAGLLFGQKTDLIQWSLPPVNLSGSVASPTFKFSQWGVDVSCGITGSATISENLSIGYDSTGLMDFLQSGKPEQLLDGLYLYNSGGGDALSATLSLKPIVSGNVWGISAYGTGEGTLKGSLVLVPDSQGFTYPFVKGVSTGKIGAKVDVIASFGVGAQGYDPYMILPRTIIKSYTFPSNIPNYGPAKSTGTNLQLNVGDNINESGQVRKPQGDTLEISRLLTQTKGSEKLSIALNGEAPSLYSTSGSLTGSASFGSLRIIESSSVVSPLVFNGGDANVTFLGGSGNDRLTFANGNNNITPGTGRDTISVGNGRNILHLGLGIDTISAGIKTALTFDVAGQPLYLDLKSQKHGGCAAGDFLSGAFTSVTGTSLGDTLITGTYPITLVGGTGDDFLTGGGHSTTLIGASPGNDDAGRGEIDTLIAGDGNDLFVLGDATKAFYDSTQLHGGGRGDYALIQKFNPVNDALLLHGAPSQYFTKLTTENGHQGLGLFYDRSDSGNRGADAELLAIIQADVKLGNSPTLTANTLIPGTTTAVFSIGIPLEAVQLKGLATGLTQFFSSLSGAMASLVGNSSLPLLGSARNEVTRDASVFASLSTNLSNLKGSLHDNEVAACLQQDLSLAGFTDIQYLDVTTLKSGLRVELRATAPESLPDTIAADLGFDSRIISLSGSNMVSGNDALSMNLAFTIDSLGAFSLDKSNRNLLDLALNDSLPVSALSGRVGLFNGTIQESTLQADSLDGLHANLEFSFSPNGKLSAVGTTGNFELHSQITTNAASQYLPSLTSGLNIGWNFQDPHPSIVLKDAQANLGALFAQDGIVNDFASGIKKATDPLVPIAETLTANLPLLDKIGIEKTPIDLLKFTNVITDAQAVQLTKASNAIKNANQIASDLKSLTEDGPVQLGSYQIGNFSHSQLPGGKTAVGTTTSPTLSLLAGTTLPELPATILQLNDKISSMQTSGLGTFSVPLLNNPTTVAGLLVGQTTDLLKWELPSLSLSKSVSSPRIATPIPGLFVTLGGSASASINLGVGYDTRGILDYQNSPSPGASQLLDGLYIYQPTAGKPLFGANLTLKAGAGLDAFIASAYVSGKVSADFSSSLAQSPGYLFQNGSLASLPLTNTISLSAGLNAQLSVGWSPFSWEEEYTLIPNQKLWSYTWGGESPSQAGNLNPRTPQNTAFADFYDFTTANDGKSSDSYNFLSKNSLNIGAFSSLIGAGAHYSPQQVVIAPSSPSGSINISIDTLGSHTYSLTANTSVISNTLPKTNLSIIADPALTQNLHFAQPSLSPGESLNAYYETLFGGAGNDTFYTYNDNNVLFGGAGNNNIAATGNNNIIYSGVGRDTISSTRQNVISFEPASQALSLNLSANTSADIFKGCAAGDTISKEIGEWIGTTLGDQMKAGPNPVILDGGLGNDTITGASVAALLIGGAGSDMITAGAGKEILIGVNELTAPASLRGAGEFDTLIGSTKSQDVDTFVLGDQYGSFYTSASGGYADIKNFKPGIDVVQLCGHAGEYHIYSYPGGIHGTPAYALQTDFAGSTYIIGYFENIASNNDATKILSSAHYTPHV